MTAAVGRSCRVCSPPPPPLRVEVDRRLAAFSSTPSSSTSLTSTSSSSLLPPALLPTPPQPPLPMPLPPLSSSPPLPLPLPGAMPPVTQAADARLSSPAARSGRRLSAARRFVAATTDGGGGREAGAAAWSGYDDDALTTVSLCATIARLTTTPQAAATTSPCPTAPTTTKLPPVPAATAAPAAAAALAASEIAAEAAVRAAKRTATGTAAVARTLANKQCVRSPTTSGVSRTRSIALPTRSSLTAVGMVAIIVTTFLLQTATIVNGEGIKKRDKSKYLTTYACQGKLMNITCEDGQVIRLIRANYGRFSITFCNSQGILDWSVNCMSRRSFRVVQTSCEKKRQCSVSAETSVFEDDPCPGTEKYLEAHYQCVPEFSTTTTYKPPLLLFPPTFPGGQAAPFPLAPSPPPLPSTTPPTIIRPSSVAPPSDAPPSSEYDEKYDDLDAPSSQPPLTPPTPPLVLHKPIGSPSRDPPSRAVTYAPALGGHFEIRVPNPLYEATSASATTSSSGSSTTSGSPAGDLLTPSDVLTHVDGRDASQQGGGSGGVVVSRATHCPPRLTRDIRWNWTRANELATHACPGGTVGQARWKCVFNEKTGGIPVWADGYPDLSSCVSIWVRHIEVKIHDGSVSVVNLANELAEKSRIKPLVGGDLIRTTELLKQLVARVEDRLTQSTDSHQRQEVLQELMNAAVDFASNLLDEQQAPAWTDIPSSEQRNAASTLLQALERNSLLVLRNQYTPLIYNRVQSNIVAAIRVVAERDLTGDVRFPEPRELAGSDWSQAGDSITIPQTTLFENARGGYVRVAFFAYRRINNILVTNFPQDTGLYGEYDPSNASRLVNSRVLSASLERPLQRPTGLHNPVRIVLQHEVLENTTDPQCIFWDFHKRDWSPEGCWFESSNGTHTTCICNHLTHFALLMNVRSSSSPYGTSESALQLITYIGCCVSIVCLSLTLVAMQICRRGLKGDRAAIHRNLCLCLLIAETIFVFGIHRTSERLLCGLIAGILHYMFLAAFMWMFLEGFQLYVMLIEVFDLEKSRLRWYYVLAYGLPLLVVCVSVAVDPMSYGTPQHCWLRADNYFVLSFVGPVVAILFANLVFLGIAIFTMCRHASLANSVKTKETSKLSSLRIWIRGATVLVFLLGLTWAFGLLYLTSESVALAYMFAVLNSIQGLFIFLFHCLANDKVQSEYRKCVVNCSWLPACLRAEKAVQGTASGPGDATLPAANMVAAAGGRVGQPGGGHPSLTALPSANNQALLAHAAAAGPHNIPNQLWNIQKSQDISTTSGIYPRAATLDRRNVIPSQVILDSTRTTPRNNQLNQQQQQQQQQQHQQLQQMIAGGHIAIAQQVVAGSGLNQHMSIATSPNTLGAIAVGRKKCNTFGGHLVAGGKSRQAPPPPYGHLEGIDHIYESIDEDQDPNGMGRQRASHHLLHAMHPAHAAAHLQHHLSQRQLNFTQFQHDFSLQQQQQLHLRSPSEISHQSDQRPLIQWGAPSGPLQQPGQAQQQVTTAGGQQFSSPSTYANHTSPISGEGGTTASTGPLVMAVFDGQRVVCQMTQQQQQQEQQPQSGHQSPTALSGGQQSPPAPQPQTPPQAGSPNHLSTDC